MRFPFLFSTCLYAGFFFHGTSAQLRVFGPDQGFCQGRNMVWNANQNGFLFFGAERADANASDGLVVYHLDTQLTALSKRTFLFPGPAFPGTIQPLFNGHSFLACGGYYLPSGASVGLLLWLDDQGDTLKTNSFPVFFGSSSIKRISTGPNGKIGLVGYRTSTQNTSSDIWIAQLDSTGNIEWERTLGGPANDVGHGIRWHTAKQAWAISGDFETSSYGNYLAFIDSQGQWLNDTLISDANANGNYVLEIDQSGRIFMAGESTTNSGPAFDVFLVSTNFAGHVQRWGYLGGTGTEAGFALICSADDSLIISGYSTTFYPELPINPYVAIVDKSFSGGRYASLSGSGIGIAYGLTRDPSQFLYATGSFDQKHFVWKLSEDSLVDLDGKFEALLTNASSIKSLLSVQWMAHKMAWELRYKEQAFDPDRLSLSDLRGNALDYNMEIHAASIFIRPQPHLPSGIYLIGLGNQWIKAIKP